MKFALLLVLLINPSADAKPIHFETSVPPNSEMARELAAAFTQAFAKKGHAFTAVEYPSKRGLEELKSGRVDGTMGRFGNLAGGPQIKNMVRIDHPLVFLTISMWCARTLDRNKANITLGLRLGNTIMAMLDSTLDKKRVTSVELNSYLSAVQMLRTGRLDCMLGNPSLMESSHVDSRDLDEFPKFDLITAASYPWISTQYADLKGFLEKELKAYPFPEAWRKKFRPEKSACLDSYDILCPDGVVFTQTIDFKDLK